MLERGASVVSNELFLLLIRVFSMIFLVPVVSHGTKFQFRVYVKTQKTSGLIGPLKSLLALEAG